MSDNEQELTRDLRNQLKELLKEELERLPDYLKESEPKERINILCKLIPFIIPKVNSISHSAWEPFQWDV